MVLGSWKALILATLFLLSTPFLLLPIFIFTSYQFHPFPLLPIYPYILSSSPTSLLLLSSPSISPPSHPFLLFHLSPSISYPLPPSSFPYLLVLFLLLFIFLYSSHSISPLLLSFYIFASHIFLSSLPLLLLSHSHLCHNVLLYCTSIQSSLTLLP